MALGDNDFFRPVFKKLESLQVNVWMNVLTKNGFGIVDPSDFQTVKFQRASISSPE